MNKNISLMIAASLLLAGGLTACKEKQKSEDIIVSKYVPETPKAPIKLPVSSRNTDVAWLGRNYLVKITREPADSAAKVVDENGQKYVDNQIRLVVARSDSSIFFNKVFTKESFASYIESDFRKQGILETIAFHEVDHHQLKFGVVVSRPENDDLFIPLDMWIDRNGGMVIKQGKLFDDTTETEEEV